MQRHTAVVALRKRQVSGVRRVLKQIRSFRVAGDADDFDLRLLLAIFPFEMFADRVLVRPGAAREGFVDDGDGRRARVVLFGKKASEQQWDAHRLKVARRDDVIADVDLLSAVELDGVSVTAALQRHADGEASRLRAWEIAGALKQLSVKTAPLLFGVPLPRQIESRRQQVFVREADVDRLRVAQRTQKQSRGAEQQQGQSDLCDDQRVAQTGAPPSAR